MVAAARLRRLSAEQTADALAIAFYQPPYSLFAGFMGSEAKALTAAQPAALGLYAAGLAADGMRGARAILEHRRGFAAAFAFVPIAELLGGLGAAWVTDSLACKIYPGCAYIDGPVDAALQARGERPLRAADVDRIEVSASALTCGMEAIGEDAAPATSLEPIAVTFSARRSLAAALLAGRLTPRQLEPAWLDGHRDELLDLAARTELREDRSLTLGVLAGIDRAVPLAPLVRAVGLRRLWRARGRILGSYRAALERRTPGRGGGGAAGSAGQGLAAVGALVRAARGAGAGFDLAASDFSRLEFRFAARVTISLRGGGELRGEQIIPLGGAGRPPAETAALAAAKLRAECAAAGAPGCADAVEEVLARAPAATAARDLAAAAVAPS